MVMKPVETTCSFQIASGQVGVRRGERIVANRVESPAAGANTRKHSDPDPTYHQCPTRVGIEGLALPTAP